MIFIENPLLADDFHEILTLFFRKLEKMSQNLLSAVVVIGALRVNSFLAIHNNCCQLAHTLVAYILNNMHPDQTAS